MNQPEPKVLDNTVRSGEKRFEFEYPVDEAWWCDDLLLVLFAPMARNEPFGSSRTSSPWIGPGRSDGSPSCRRRPPGIATTTSSPTSRSVYSVKSYTCEIDPRTGKILRKVFTK